ncbi:MAG TPA: efflux transporter outer membrane subunit [Burkholderiales bacterium]|nr:efflux transporter outer membrane subunit [Burkholderiales bacterium]
MKPLSRIGFLSILALVAGCSLEQPKHELPALELPQAWKDSAPRYAEDGRWWQIYGDPQLDALVDEAIQHNADLAIAVARVDESRALSREAESLFWPSVDARAAASRQQISQRTATFFPGVPTRYNDYRATLNVSYEVDIFGRLRAGARAAKAELQADEAARDAVRLAVAAQVAQSYFGLRALDERVEITRETVRLREDALGLQKKRFDGGVISEFEYRQLEAEAAAVRSQLPPLEAARDAQEAALLALIGKNPREIFEGAVSRKTAYNEAPSAPVLPSGVPSELLLRRADLVEAERVLAATDARVDAARADMFPSITLTGAYGVASSSLSNLFTGPAGIWALGAGLVQPIFQGGRLQARSEAAQARQRQALAQYQRAIQNAFSEVRSALIVQSRARESYEAQSTRAEALATTARLARLRYVNGVASQLDVLDAERGLLDARSARIEALRAHRAAIADLFRALGG